MHAAIGAFVADARHLAELRLRLRQAFESFTVDDDGEMVALVPRLRAEALDSAKADLCAIRREAVRATTDANGFLRIRRML